MIFSVQMFNQENAFIGRAAQCGHLDHAFMAHCTISSHLQGHLDHAFMAHCTISSHLQAQAGDGGGGGGALSCITGQSRSMRLILV